MITPFFLSLVLTSHTLSSLDIAENSFYLSESQSSFKKCIGINRNYKFQKNILKNGEVQNFKDVLYLYRLINDLNKEACTGFYNKNEVLKGIEFFVESYMGSDHKVGNWWFWELAIPRQINLLLINTKFWLPKDLYTKLLEASYYHLPDPKFQYSKVGLYGNRILNKGANRVDAVLIAIQRAVLADNESDIEYSLNNLWSVLDYVESGDGFYSDGGFIQHQDMPYIGTYGAVLFDGIADILILLKGTKWEATVDKYDLIIKRITENFLPFINDGYVYDFVRGRAISRKNSQSHENYNDFNNTLLKLYKASPLTHKLKFKTLLDKLERTAKFKNSKYYPSINRLIYYGNNYTSALAMHSYRVGNYECINGENLKGWFTSDGMNYVYLKPDDYYKIWPYLDLSTPPGTTTGSKPKICEGRRVYNGKKKELTWVIGLAKSNYAIAGMDFFNWDKSLSMKKSWFYFPNFIVAIGSDGNGAENTNIMQRFFDANSLDKLYYDESSNYFFYKDKANNVSYGVYFPYKQLLKKDFEPIYGNWKDINSNYSQKLPEELPKWRLKLDIKHDINSQDYSYILMPNANVDDLKLFSRQPPIEIIAKDDNSHIIYNAKERTYMINSFSRGPLKVSENIFLTGEMSALVLDSDSTIEVTLSVPDKGVDKVSFLLNKTNKNSKLKQVDNRAEIVGNQVFINTKNLKGNQYSFKVIF